MLQGNIKIFQIIGKQFTPKGIEFTLHKPIRYLESRESRIFLTNQPPFDHYQIGHFLGINVNLVRHSFFATSKVWDGDDRDVVSKVVAKPPQFYLKQNIFSSDEFGDGWAEE